MKKTYKITYGNSLTINRQNYENEKPLYSETIEFEVDENEKIDEKKEFIKLKTKIDALCEEHYAAAKLDLSKVRIRVRDGIRCPSVTSILGLDGIPLAKDVLEKYAVRGIEIERIIREWSKTKKWQEPQAEIFPLEWTDINYKSFCENPEHKIEWDLAEWNIEVWNLDKKYSYSGEVDLYLPVNGLMTILDIKTGGYKFEQVAAYGKAFPRKVEQVGFADLKKGKLNVKPFADCGDYWYSFLVERGRCRERYGV